MPAQTARMAWAVDRRAVRPPLACPLPNGAAAAVLLADSARAMRPVLAEGAVSERLRQALPALLVITVAAGAGRMASALAS
ncbi:hypothetical protein [Streptomyces mirabilis]|uniref:hypothetical protein n=1 Tax=Streptomyces mirabilis TaxID=68239 RepID=UPI003698402F